MDKDSSSNDLNFNGSKWKLRGSLVAVELDEAWDLQGGIALPESNNTPVVVGTVRATGPGALFENGDRERMTVSPGDRVLFRPYHIVSQLTDRLSFYHQEQLDCILKDNHIIALRDRVVVSDWVKPLQDAIIRPDTVEPDYWEGRAHSVGPGIPDESGKPRPLGINPGQKVYFRRWSALPFNLNDKLPFFILRPAHIVGVE